MQLRFGPDQVSPLTRSDGGLHFLYHLLLAPLWLRLPLSCPPSKTNSIVASLSKLLGRKKSACLTLRTFEARRMSWNQLQGIRYSLDASSGVEWIYLLWMIIIVARWKISFIILLLLLDTYFLFSFMASQTAHYFSNLYNLYNLLSIQFYTSSPFD